MLLLGDIGNTETKICLVSLNKKIISELKSIYEEFIDQFPKLNLKTVKNL